MSLVYGLTPTPGGAVVVIMIMVLPFPRSRRGRLLYILGVIAVIVGIVVYGEFYQ